MTHFVSSFFRKINSFRRHPSVDKGTLVYKEYFTVIYKKIIINGVFAFTEENLFIGLEIFNYVLSPDISFTANRMPHFFKNKRIVQKINANIYFFTKYYPFFSLRYSALYVI